MNEDSRGLIKYYRRRNYVPSPKTSYIIANTQKDEETCIYVQDNTHMCPRACHRRPEHAFSALTCAPGMCNAPRA